MRFSGVSNNSDMMADTAVRLRILRRTSPGQGSLRILITLPIFGLFMEWLLALQGMGGDKGPIMLETLSILAGVLLLQGLFTIRGWVWLPINLFVVVLLWGRLFGGEQPLFWLSQYIVNVVPQDVNALTNRWLFSDLSDETRALVLLLGWGVMVSAVHMLSLYRGTIWLFGGTTIIYLSVMEAAIGHSVYDHMIKSLCYILLAQGLMLLLRLRNEESTNSVLRSGRANLGRIHLLGWTGSVLISTCILTFMIRAGGELVPARSGSDFTVSTIAEHFQEWSSRMSSQNVNSGASLTGYNSFGSDMGGPLKRSKELFFTAETPVPTYWRGESLQYYDGRRWSAHMSVGIPAKISDDLSGNLLETNDRGDKVNQTIILEAPPYAGMPLFSGGTITRIDEVNGIDGKKLEPSITAAPESGSLFFTEDDLRVAGYTLEAELETPKEKLQMRSFGPDPDSIVKSYLQLPDSLPQKVYDLAKNVTNDVPGRYEKAAAVESYLEREYTYTLKTKVPPAGRDFTDHFLFDTKEGYCTHFATAMVVMLRTQGIPARYVMGFAPGEKVQGSEHSYRVTQEQAHAWVEVYFPGEGWVAFDPTPGYSTGLDGVTLQAQPSEIFPSSLLRLKEMMQTIGDSVREWFVGFSSIMIAILIVLIASSLMAVKELKQYRKKGFSGRGTAVASTERDRLVFISERVWKQIEKKYGAMEPGITVKKYIQSLTINDDKIRTEIEVFASRWERIAYMKEPLSRTEKKRFKSQCRTIVKNRV